MQFTATLAADHATGSGTGLADRAGVKYRLINDETHGFSWQFFLLPLPTSTGPESGRSAAAGLGQFDLARWSPWRKCVTLQRGPGKRDFWEGGCRFPQSCAKAWAVDAEVARSSAEEAGAHGATIGADVAVNFHVGGAFSLVGALGPVFENCTPATDPRACISASYPISDGAADHDQ